MAIKKTTVKKAPVSAKGAAPAVGQGSASGGKPKKVVSKKPASPKKTVSKVAKEPAKEHEVTVTKEGKGERYVYAVGRRKTAIAQVRLYPSATEEETLVNKLPIGKYFGTETLKAVALTPLKASGMEATCKVTVVVRGSGLQSQAGAVRLGIARCLIKRDPLLRPTLKALGYLTRDARAVERKKPGLKKARRAPQWAKR